ncbi:MAG: endonuclease [Flavobacterium sp.]
MLKTKITFFFLLFVSLVIAQIPSYYNGINFTQNGQALKNALANRIISTHTNELTYSQVWNALKIVDLDPNNSNNVLLIYGWENGTDGDGTNDRSRDKDNNGGSNGQWNREHTYPQSVGTPELGQTGPGADAHMLRACDVQRNNSRGNRRFANGSGITSYSIGSNSWFPGDEWKGDLARMMMYMYLRYGDQCLPTNVGVGSTAGTGDDMIDLFLIWNVEDPVSAFEINRNNYLGNANNTWGQGNRNPFIDNPYLATKIWGGVPAQDTWGTLSTEIPVFESTVSVYPNPVKDQIVYIQTENTVEEIVLMNINGQYIQKVNHPTKVQNTYNLDGLQSGFYFLQITSNNQTVTKKIVVQ